MAPTERFIFYKLAERKLKPVKRLTNSGLGMYKQCPWKYKMWKLGVKPNTLYIPFATGSAIHIGTATLYTKHITRASDRFNHMMDILESKWNRNIAVNTSAEYLKRMTRQFYIIRGMLYGMVKQRIIEKDLDEYEVIQTESKLSAPLLYGIHWEGTPDIVLKEKKTGEYTHFDHKSTSRVTDDYIKSLDTSVELEGDRFLIEAIHNKIISHGFYNILQKHYLYEKKGETQEAYADRILEQYAETKFHFRYRKDYARGSNTDWLSQQAKWIKSIQHSQLENVWPMNDHNCVGFYTCDMLPFCSAKTDHMFTQFYTLVKEKKKGKK